MLPVKGIGPIVTSNHPPLRYGWQALLFEPACRSQRRRQVLNPTQLGEDNVRKRLFAIKSFLFLKKLIFFFKVSFFRCIAPNNAHSKGANHGRNQPRGKRNAQRQLRQGPEEWENSSPDQIPSRQTADRRWPNALLLRRWTTPRIDRGRTSRRARNCLRMRKTTQPLKSRGALKSAPNSFFNPNFTRFSYSCQITIFMLLY